jgi:hypothetical protein
LEQPGGGVARVSGKVESGRRGGFIGAVGLDEGARLIQNLGEGTSGDLLGARRVCPNLSGRDDRWDLLVSGWWLESSYRFRKEGRQAVGRKLAWAGVLPRGLFFLFFFFSLFFSFEICLKFTNNF